MTKEQRMGGIFNAAGLWEDCEKASEAQALMPVLGTIWLFSWFGSFFLFSLWRETRLIADML